MTDTEFTREVLDSLQAVRRMRNRFQDRVSTLGSQEIWNIRPKDLYEALQLAHDSNQVLESFFATISAEEAEHTRRKKDIRDNCDATLQSIRSDGFQKITNLKQAVGRLDRVAKLVSGNTVANQFRFSNSRSLQPETVKDAFNAALRDAIAVAEALPANVYENHKTTAAWSAGVFAFGSWIFAGASFLWGLAIGGMAAGLVFAHYFRRKQLAREAIKVLAEASGAQVSNIQNSVELDEKRQQQLLASRLTVEAERFGKVQKHFAKTACDIEGELIDQLDRFLALSKRWTDEYAALVGPFDGDTSSGDDKTSVLYTRLGQVALSSKRPMFTQGEKEHPRNQPKAGKKKTAKSKAGSRRDTESQDQVHKPVDQPGDNSERETRRAAQ